MQFSLDHEGISIPFFKNMQCTELGLDSLPYCLDKQWFVQYPDTVLYSLNKAGYRTHNEINHDCILAIGDSFTFGLGVNSEQRYTNILEQQLNYQVANVSLCGASNDWMSRKLEQLLGFIKPKAVIVHYSFSHRRERQNTNWEDNERTECEPLYTVQENFDNWYKNFNYINMLCKNTQVIHSFIPNWHEHPLNYTSFGTNVIAPCIISDFARDKFHYGAETHQQLADTFTNLLACG
jgi:hypothetical protein